MIQSNRVGKIDVAAAREAAQRVRRTHEMLVPFLREGRTLAEIDQEIARILELYEMRLKSISFLPLTDHNYPQAPYQEISGEAFEAASAKLKPVVFGELNTDELQDMFCDSDKCVIEPREEKIRVPQELELTFADAEETAGAK